jgi:predicted deacylase
MALPLDLPAPPETRFVEVKDRSYYVYAPDQGVFEPLVELGAMVEAGQPAALIHFVDDPAREPALCRFARAGLAICRRAMGRAERGDCLFHLATAMAEPD